MSGNAQPATTGADICIGSNVGWLVSFGVPRETAQRCTEQLADAVRADERERIAQWLEAQDRLPYAMQRYVRLEDARIVREGPP